MAHLQVMPLSEKARGMYEKAGHYHDGDSGFDLYVVEDQTIEPGETAFIKLGIMAAAFTAKTSSADVRNVSWLLMPRSSIYKTPLRLCNSVGLIDAGYRGEVMLVVDNIKSHAHTVKTGERLVQAVSFTGDSWTFEIVQELSETNRGKGGFGSTK